MTTIDGLTSSVGSWTGELKRGVELNTLVPCKVTAHEGVYCGLTDVELFHLDYNRELDYYRKSEGFNYEAYDTRNIWLTEPMFPWLEVNRNSKVNVVKETVSSAKEYFNQKLFLTS